MNLHLRRLSAALMLAFPLAVVATEAVALDTSATDLAPSESAASSGPAPADTSGVDHDDSDSERAATLEPEHGEMSGSEHAATVDDAHRSAGVSRPRALVLGSFGLANAGVVVSAAVLRRRTPDRPKRRPAERATAPTAP